MTGAETTLLSRTMARRRLTFAPVSSPNLRPPSGVSEKPTVGSPRRPFWTRAFFRSVPVTGTLLRTAKNFTPVVRPRASSSLPGRTSTSFCMAGGTFCMIVFGSLLGSPSTRRNWSWAVVLMMSLTRAGSSTPGSWMTMRFPLSGAMIGSVTPRASTRLRIVSTECSMVSRSSALSADGFILNSSAPSAVRLRSVVGGADAVRRRHDERRVVHAADARRGHVLLGRLRFDRFHGLIDFEARGIADVHPHDQVRASFEIEAAANRLGVCLRRDDRRGEADQHGEDQHDFPGISSSQDFLQEQAAASLRARLTRQNAGDGRTRNLDLHILGNFEIDDVGLNTLNCPVNPTRGDDAIAFFQRAQHLLRLLPLLARRGDDEEVEDEKNRRDRQDVQQQSHGAAGILCLKQSNRNHQDPSFVGAERKVSRKAPNESSAIACRTDRIKSR